MKIIDSISINAPVEKVFNVFTDLNRAEERVSGITNIEVLEGPAKLKKGTKWRETRILFGKEATETMWVTDLIKNQSYIVEADSHGTKYTSSYTFTQSDSGTDVKMTFEGTPYSLSARLLSIFGLLFKGATKKALHKDLADLKSAAENKQ